MKNIKQKKIIGFMILISRYENKRKIISLKSICSELPSDIRKYIPRWSLVIDSNHVEYYCRTNSAGSRNNT